jgi:hypothetical protein
MIRISLVFTNLSSPWQAAFCSIAEMLQPTQFFNTGVGTLLKTIFRFGEFFPISSKAKMNV